MVLQFRLYTTLLGVLICMAAVSSAHADNDDPPGRAARLSYAHGATSFLPAGEEEWLSTSVNRPLVSGDRLWSDGDGRAEIQVGGADLRIGADTSLELVNLDDSATQVEMTQGSLYVSLRHFSRGQVFEVDTPTLALMFKESGRYRIDVDSGGRYTTVAVVRGSAVALGDRAEYPLEAGDRLRFRSTDLRDAQALGDVEDDAFDRFSTSRDERAQRGESMRYVGDDVVGADDLDEYGSWSAQAEYGHVWYPSHVDANWAPYSDGHWLWQDPWGWTWVDNAPWGFAPSHYGRWVSIQDRWGWVPGPRAERAVYAPALVAFIGGSGFSVGISVGGGGGPIGWFPLGVRDVYAPPYHASRDYFTRVNVTNTTINNINITNVYKSYSSGAAVTQDTYANRTVRGAVTAVPGNVFINAQPVRAASIKVDAKVLASAPIARMAAVAPIARSVYGSATAARVRPSEAVLERKVVARTPPPPRAVGFASRKQELQRSPGTPLAPSAIEALQPKSSPAAEHNVRVLGPQSGAVNVRKAGGGNSAQAAADKEASSPKGTEPAADKQDAVPAPKQERATPPGKDKQAVPVSPQEPLDRASAERPDALRPRDERKAPPGIQKRAAPAAASDAAAEAAPVERPAAVPPERNGAAGRNKRDLSAPAQDARDASPRGRKDEPKPMPQERQPQAGGRDKGAAPEPKEGKAPADRLDSQVQPVPQQGGPPRGKPERATAPPEQPSPEQPPQSDQPQPAAQRAEQGRQDRQQESKQQREQQQPQPQQAQKQQPQPQSPEQQPQPQRPEQQPQPQRPEKQKPQPQSPEQQPQPQRPEQQSRQQPPQPEQRQSEQQRKQPQDQQGDAQPVPKAKGGKGKDKDKDADKKNKDEGDTGGGG